MLSVRFHVLLCYAAAATILISGCAAPQGANDPPPEDRFVGSTATWGLTLEDIPDGFDWVLVDVMPIGETRLKAKVSFREVIHSPINEGTANLESPREFCAVAGRGGNLTTFSASLNSEATVYHEKYGVHYGGPVGFRLNINHSFVIPSEGSSAVLFGVAYAGEQGAETASTLTLSRQDGTGPALFHWKVIAFGNFECRLHPYQFDGTASQVGPWHRATGLEATFTSNISLIAWLSIGSNYRYDFTFDAPDRNIFAERHAALGVYRSFHDAHAGLQSGAWPLLVRELEGSSQPETPDQRPHLRILALSDVPPEIVKDFNHLHAV